MTLDELVKDLQRLQHEGHGHLEVITDVSQVVLGAEYSSDEPPAIVIDVGYE